MKMLGFVSAVALLCGSFSAGAELVNCKIVTDNFDVPVIDEMTSLTSVGDALDLNIAIQVPNPNGGGLTGAIASTFKRPRDVNKSIYKSGGLTLNLERRNNAANDVAVKITGTAKTDYGKVPVDVIMFCQEK